MAVSRPDHKSLIALGQTHAKGKRWQDALQCFQDAHRGSPNDPEPVFRIANLLREVGRTSDAIAIYLQAIGLKPDHFAAHNNLADLYRETGRLADAISHYRLAQSLAPQHAEISNNLAAALHDQGHYNEAIEHASLAITLKENYAKAFFNRGVSHHKLRDLNSAVLDYNRARSCGMQTAELFSNCGVAELELGHTDSAIQRLRDALKIDPDYVEAEWNLSLALLSQGQFDEGWRRYESRWRWSGFPSAQLIPGLPMWSGKSSLKERIVLIYCEQGLGDTIQFARYLRLIQRQEPKKVLMIAQRSLHTLLKHNYPFIDLIRRDEIQAQGAELQVPLLSLPLAFSTRIDCIPDQAPALTSPNRLLDPAELQNRVRPRVGVVWSGGSRPDRTAHESVNQRRNIAFSHISSFQSAQASFFSFQKGEPAESNLQYELAQLWKCKNFVNLAPLLNDFSDTASWLAEMDLLISVDTSTAHLAAAMGKRVWLLNRFSGCWRWLLGREDSPWYPTLRIYRQPKEGDWESVVKRVRQDLDRFVVDFRSS